jgi:hypothetical protein
MPRDDVSIRVIRVIRGEGYFCFRSGVFGSGTSAATDFSQV